MPLRLSGLASGLDTDSIITELMKVQRLKSTKIEQKKTLAEWTQEKWKAMNTKLYSFYTGSLAKMRMQGSFATKAAAASDTGKVSVTASVDATEGTHTLKINQLAKSQFVTGAQLASNVTSSTTLESLGIAAGTIDISVGGTTKSITVDPAKSITNLVNQLKSAGINASYDATQKRFFLSSKESGAAKAFYIQDTSTIDLAGLGLASFDSDTAEGQVDIDGTNSMTLVTAKDASFVYNGAAMTSSSNSVTANGLTFNLLATTDDEEVSISVTNDTNAVYETIKSFINDYNALIADMNASFYSTSAKGYNPLTDDEKAAMTDDQIEKWESKIKESLLRRDGTVGSLLSTMRENLGKSVTVNGVNYALSSFGIVTGEYTERGLLHINGDADDSLVSGKTNDLMKALKENPEAVMKTLNKLTDDLYKSFTESMKSTTLRSALTFYNDKEIAKSITDYESDLKEMEKKLTKMEDRYYKQFSAMEAAMAKLNSQSANLAAMLGTNNK